MSRAYEIAVELAGRVSRSFNSSVLSAAGNLDELNSTAHQLETQRNRVTRFDNLQREIGQTEQQFGEAQAKAAQLAQQFEDSKGPTRALANSLKDAEGEVQRLAHQMRNADEPTEAMVQQLAAAREHAAAVRKEFKAAERQTNSFGREMDRANREARKLENTLDGQRSELSQLGSEMEEAGQSTANLTKEQRRLAAQLQRVERRASGWRQVMGADVPGAVGRSSDAIGNLARNATIAAGTVGAATGFMVTGFADSATETDQWASRLGIATDELSRLEYVGRQYGIQQDAMIDGIKELSLRADEFAVTGVGPAEEAFSRLGLSQQQVADLSGDTAKLFDVVADKLRGIENVAARQRIVDEIFGGTGGEQMAELASASADEIERLKNRADELGFTLGKQGGKAAREYTRALRESQGALIGVRNTMALALLPALTSGMREMSQWVADNQENLQAWGNTLRDNLVDALPQIMEAAKGIGSYLGTMAEMTASVAGLLGGYDNLAIAVAAAFSAKAVASIFSVIGALASAAKGAWILATSTRAVAAAQKLAAGAQWLLNAAMAANPIGLVITGIAALVAAGYLLWKNWDDISAKAAEAWASIKAYAGDALDSVTSWIMGFEVAQWVAEKFNAARDWMAAFSLADVTDGILATAKDAWAAFTPVAWMTEAWQAALDYLASIDLFESGKAIMATLGDGIIAMKDELVGKVEGVFADVREYLPFSDARKGPFSQLTLSGQRIVTTIGEGVAKAGSAAISKPLAAGMAASMSAGMAVAGQGIEIPVRGGLSDMPRLSMAAPQVQQPEVSPDIQSAALAAQRLQLEIEAKAPQPRADTPRALSESIGADKLNRDGTSAGKVVQLTYRPTITVQGGDSATTRRDVSAALTQSNDDLLARLREQYEDEERLSYD